MFEKSLENYLWTRFHNQIMISKCFVKTNFKMRYLKRRKDNMEENKKSFEKNIYCDCKLKKGK